jgi:hypothetical protein
VTDALDRVIDAALERALLADDTRRYFALAGALERGRSAARTDGAGVQRRERDDPEQRSPEPPRDSPPTDVLGAALLSTVAVGALDATRAGDIDPGAWSPGESGGGPHAELVAAGAAAACRRFDVEPGTVAARADLPTERLAPYRTDSGGATEPE